MSKILLLIRKGVIKDIVFGLCRSYINSYKVLSIKKDFHIQPGNIASVYDAALTYYNHGFAVNSGYIDQTVVEDYINLITIIFSTEINQEKTASMTNYIQEDDALLDFSLLCFYILLMNYKQVRLAVWEDFTTYEFALSSLYHEIYETSSQEFRYTDITTIPSPFENWRLAANKILLHTRERYHWIDIN